MKLIILLFLPLSAFADFYSDAEQQANHLKKTLMTNLMAKMKEGGPVSAIDFCHEQALPLTDKAKKHKLPMGRTSIKVRNPKNKPEEWITSYLETATKTNAAKPFPDQVVKLANNKKAFLTPLYVAAPCLQCHGTLSGQTLEMINKLYPNDLAKGYKLGEFRGFVWVKQ